MWGPLLLCCAVLPPAGAAAGQVFVYARELTEARKWMPLSCQGEVVAELRAGTLFVLNLPPGFYTLAGKGGVPVSLQVHPDDRLFVRIDWSFSASRPPAPILRAVPARIGEEETRRLFYVEGKRIRSPLVLPQDPRAGNGPKLETRQPR